MAQYPIEIDDQAGLNEAVNYLLSGPAGLGQNFQGFSAYLPAYLRPSTRQPWDLDIDSTLNPSVYLALSISNIVPVGVQPTREIQVTFSSAQPSAPFEYGDRVQIIGANPGADYNGTYTVYSCTTTDVILFTTGSFTYPAYVSGGTVGRNYLDGTAMDTDCNARVTVAGPTDQVFVSAQLNLSYEYDCTTATNYDVIVRITRLRGFPDTTPGSNDYQFKDTVLVSRKTFTKSLTVGTGTDTLEAIFTTVLDGPNLDFGYYWYILTVEYVMPGGILLENNSQNFTLSGTTAALGATTTYSGISPTTTTGAGTGLVVDIELQANAGGEDYEYYIPPDPPDPASGNTTINIVTSGSGYLIGDEILIAGTSLGGASPANDMVLVIDSIGPPFDATIGKVTTGLRSLTAQSIKQ